MTADEPRPERASAAEAPPAITGTGVTLQREKATFATILSFVEGSVLGTMETVERNQDSGAHDTRAGQDTGQNRQAPSIRGYAAASGMQLDRKQYAAYKILCCSFLLGLVKEGALGPSTHNRMRGVIDDLDRNTDTSLSVKRREIDDLLRKHGGKDQLIMLLTGQAGCGKSTCVSLAQKYCHAFCAHLVVMFNDMSFTLTSTTGPSAAIFGGATIHSAAHMNCKNITDAMRKEWKNVNVIVLDEVSFFKTTDMDTLDRKLRGLKNENKPYGGVHIVFSGDFHQLQPGELIPLQFGTLCFSITSNTLLTSLPDLISTVLARKDELLYGHSESARGWQNTLNCAIILEKTHRFDGDEIWAGIMSRLRVGELTTRDREIINSRVISEVTGVRPPTGPDVFRVVPSNKERNSIQCLAFQKLLAATHPDMDEEGVDPPDHTLFIEASFRRGNKPLSQSLSDFITANLGDDDLRVTSPRNVGNAKIDPLLRIFFGALLMIITNEHLKEHNRANGTICRCVGVKLKPGARRQIKNWDGESSMLPRKPH